MQTFEMSNIDPHTCPISTLEQEIERLTKIKNIKTDEEQSIKNFIVSIYGGLGSQFYTYYNPAIAEAITLQGQDLDKYTSSIIDDYFKNHWINDKELHEILGITNVNPIKADTVIIYQDTDSCYVTFAPILMSCNYNGDIIDFIIKIKKHRLTEYLKNKYNIYAQKFNTINKQDLELEKISYVALMISKKKYVLDFAWNDSGVRFEPQSKITPVGIEIVEGSTSPFARKTLKDLIVILFKENKNLNYVNLIKRLKEIKKNFILQNPENISITIAIGDYNKTVLEDNKEIILGEKCPINNRASAVYNHKLLNSKWKTKYPLIKTGDKIKYYYTTTGDRVFGYLPNNYPIEFATPVDYDVQFEKTIIHPFNRLIEAIGLNSIPGNLIVCKSLF